MSTHRPAGIAEYSKSLIIAFFLALIIKFSVVEAYKIPSSSMEDTLLVGDFLLANKFIYGFDVPLTSWRVPGIRNPEPGDVVIFRWPEDRKTNYIKRCVATEGQVVKIVDKVLYVDGEEFPNPEFAKFEKPRILSRARGVTRDNYGPYVVPKGHIFTMGDNRDNSYDSRFWGPVPLDLLQGEALIIHWSWEPDSAAPQVMLEDLTTIPKAFGHFFVHFYKRVRWSRLATIID